MVSMLQNKAPSPMNGQCGLRVGRNRAASTQVHNVVQHESPSWFQDGHAWPTGRREWDAIAQMEVLELRQYAVSAADAGACNLFESIVGVEAAAALA